MHTSGTVLPVKCREMMNHHLDSTIWNDVVFRSDDIVIATYAKSGTTWIQQIVGQLIFNGDPDVDISALSPWVDLRIPSKAERLAQIEAMQHRRFLKTHLPVDALRMDERARYIYCARDGRDVAWSLHNHHFNANDLWFQLLNETPGRVGPPVPRADPDVRRYFETWLQQDGAPFWPFWENVRSWWALRHHPSVLLLHFNDLKRDLPGGIARIAAFLEIDIADGRPEQIIEHCGFDWMKRHAERVAPLGGACWDGGAGTFVYRGTNGRWRDILTDQENARYLQTAHEELGADCARWLAEGKL